jgi:ribosomal 50S subunit-recycling heat shock protein
MCDYSLHHVMSTPAKVGDKLVSTSFVHASTRGFCAEGRPDVAVCVMPGTELAFEADIECDRGMSFLPRRKIAARVARFRQVDLDKPHAHHDALELPDGQIVMVTNLLEGQRLTVLQLPQTAQPEGEAKEVHHEETRDHATII